MYTNTVRYRYRPSHTLALTCLGGPLSRGKSFSSFTQIERETSMRTSNEKSVGEHTNVRSLRSARRLTFGPMFTRKRTNGMAVGKRSKRSMRSTDQPQALIPGILDNITLDLITPKLPWRDLLNLSCVCRPWEEAMRTKKVHEARVRAMATETLIVHTHVQNGDADKKVAFALYSTITKRCFELPPIPGVLGAAMCNSKCIAWDGKLYVLGGLEAGEPPSRVLLVERPKGEVYMLDLGGGEWKWEQRASMLVPRFGFNSAVMDGRIYVFGGMSGPASKRLGTTLQSEVYDIKENAWSPITPMTRRVTYYRSSAAAVGTELFVYDKEDGSTTEIYSPAKNEWRSLDPFGLRTGELLFICKEKCYKFSASGILVYDEEQKSWVNRYSHSLTGLGPDYELLVPQFVTAGENDLFLTTVDQSTGRCHIFQGEGFTSESKNVVWQSTNCTFRHSAECRIRCPIQL